MGWCGSVYLGPPAQRIWLYSARADRVIPLRNSMALHQAIGLDEIRHVWLEATHYTAILYLPGVAEMMLETIQAVPPS